MKSKSTIPKLQGNYAALYMRLSREDDTALESASIATQRKILHSYAKENAFTVYDEYIDDGWSGTNFDRPAFNRLKEDIEANKVNIVITKDLSRLGRNSARTTDLIDEYFPLHKIRYISVSEGIDTAFRCGLNKVAPITNVVNEWYARDISDKINDAFNIKRKKGEFIGSFAPYGYEKDPDNKNHLVVDENSAVIVRQIFDMARQGHNPTQIARTLDKQGTVTPAEYRCQKFPHLNIENYSQRRKWQAGSVSKILKNMYYLGHTVQGKTTKPSFKSKSSVANAPEDWIVVLNTHKPIVDEETWNMVQRLTQGRTCKKGAGFTNIFSGLAKCADCGRNMSSVGTRKKGSPANLACGAYKLYGKKECTNHYIDYNVLAQTILEILRTKIKLTEADKEELLQQMKSADQKDSRAADDTVYKETQKKLELVRFKIEKLFDDKYSGHIPAEQFKHLRAKYEAEQKTLLKKAQYVSSNRQEQGKTDDMLEQKTSQTIRYSKFRELIEDYTENKELNRELLFKLIDHIEVGQGEIKKMEHGRVKTQNIKIYFRFQCEPQKIQITV